MIGIMKLTILGLTVSGCFRTADNENGQAAESIDQTVTAPPDHKVSEAEYQQSLSEILKPYWATGQTDGIKDQILALIAPAEYLNLHFDLVVAFELMEQGNLKGDSVKINQGVTKLNQLKSQFTWLDNESNIWKSDWE